MLAASVIVWLVMAMCPAARSEPGIMLIELLLFVYIGGKVGQEYPARTTYHIEKAHTLKDYNNAPTCTGTLSRLSLLLYFYSGCPPCSSPSAARWFQMGRTWAVPAAHTFECRMGFTLLMFKGLSSLFL